MTGNSDHDAAMAAEPGIRFPDDTAVQDAAAYPVQADADADDARAKFTLALSASDKLALKMAAAKRNITVAKLVHEWIATLSGPGQELPEPVVDTAAHWAGEPGGPVDVQGRPAATGRTAGQSLDEIRAAFHGAFVAAARYLTVADLARLGLRPDTAGISPDGTEALGQRTLFDIICEVI